jgi:membrane protein DedA with SNARE-associated domain
LPALLIPIGILVIASNVANVTYATLVETHPLWLLGLSSINRYLALVTPHTAAWSYFLVGAARLLAPDPFFYLLGYWYGDRGLHALERHLPSVGSYYRQFERLFRRASYPVVFVAPNNAVCLFAGASRMNPVGFAVANVTGTIARLALIRVLGNIFASPLRSTTDLLDRWKWYLLAISAVIVGLTLLADRRRGRSQLGGLRRIGQTLGADDEPDDRGEPAAQSESAEHGEPAAQSQSAEHGEPAAQSQSAEHGEPAVQSESAEHGGGPHKPR